MINKLTNLFPFCIAFRIIISFILVESANILLISFFFSKWNYSVTSMFSRQFCNKLKVKNEISLKRFCFLMNVSTGKQKFKSGVNHESKIFICVVLSYQ